MEVVQESFLLAGYVEKGRDAIELFQGSRENGKIKVQGCNETRDLEEF